MKTTRRPKPGEVWRSRVQHEEKRTVLVLDNDADGQAKDTDGEVAGARVRTQTLTTAFGNPPLRATRTRVLLTNWHHTFAYDRDATARELADAGLDIPRSDEDSTKVAAPAGFFATTTGAPTGDYRTKHRYVTVEDLAQIILDADTESALSATAVDVLAEAIVSELGKEG